MKQINVAFFGTSDRSVPILESLNSHFNLVLCVTKTDSLVGRKQEVRQTEVKKWTIERDIPFVEVDTMKGEEAERVISEMKSRNVNYGIVADFSLMIPSSIISEFRNKLINIHFSLLPKYRGASPVQFTILNGDKLTGITYLLVEEGLDNGAVLDAIEYNMGTTRPTSGELYRVLFEIAGEHLPEILNSYISDKIVPTLQDETTASYTYSRSHSKRTFIYKEDAQIDWKLTPEEIDRAVRAFNPWPIAWTTLADLEEATGLFHRKVELRQDINKELKLKIFSTDIKDNKLEILTLQVEGRNKFTWNDFANGYLKRVN